jgi:hypothetical protein
MRSLLAFLALALPAFSQTVYLRYGGPGSRTNVTAATNSSPIRITATHHGFVAGDPVWIYGVRGNPAANGLRKVKNVSGDSFDITDFNGVDIAGVGPYEGSGFVGKVRPTTIVGHPRGLLDGPGGTITTRALDPDNAGPAKAPQAITGFAPWDALTSYGSTWVSNPWAAASLSGVDSGEPLLSLALVWYSDHSKTQYRTALLQWLDGIEKVLAHMASGNPYFGTCDESSAGCGEDEPELDWRSFRTAAIADTYSLMRSEMTTVERQTFANKMLNGLFGESCANRLAWGGGLVTTNGTTVTCNGPGCNFLSIPNPAGRWFYIRHGTSVYGQWRKIASVQSDTQLTLQTVASSYTDKPWAYEGDWTETSCGNLWWSAHHGYTPAWVPQTSYTVLASAVDASTTTIRVANGAVIPSTAAPYWVIVDNEWMKVVSRSGNTLTVARGQLFTTAASHNANVRMWGTAFPPDGSGNKRQPDPLVNPTWQLDMELPHHNLYWCKLYGEMMTGLALLDDDDRARKLFEQAWNYWYDFVYMDAKNRWVGITQGAFSYGQPRWNTWMTEVAFVGKYNLSPAIDTTDGEWLKAGLEYSAHATLPWSAGDTTFVWGDSGTDATMYPRFYRYLMQGQYLFPGSREAATGMFWYRNIFGKWTANELKAPYAFQVMPHAYLYVLPSITCPGADCTDYRTDDNRVRFFTKDDFDWTSTPTSYNLVISRNDWTSKPLSYIVQMSNGEPNDHTGTAAPGNYNIAVNGQWIHANDVEANPDNYGATQTSPAYGYAANYGTNSYPDIDFAAAGSGYSHGIALPGTRKNSIGYYSTFVKVDKTAKSSSTHYWRVNLTNAYQSSATVTRAYRHFVHLLGSQPYLVVYDDLATSKSDVKQRSVFCYADDGVASVQRTGANITCTRTQSRLSTAVLLPANAASFTDTPVQYYNSLAFTYGSWSSSQRPDGARRSWTLQRNVAMLIDVQIDSVNQTIGMAGVDIGKQWYSRPGSPVVFQCDNTSANTCPGAQEPAPTSTQQVRFDFYADIGYGTTLKNGSTTNSEFLVVHRPSANVADTMPQTSLLTTISTNATGAMIQDPVTPQVVVFSNNGTSPNTSVSYSVSGFASSAHHVISGLATGTYSVNLNGAPLLASASVGSDGMLEFSGTSGAYAVTQTGAVVPMDILTRSPLPGGTVGMPYNDQGGLVGSGGQAPYTWQRTGGDAWPDGLTLSSDGRITGTPTASQIRNVIVSACDSAQPQQCVSKTFQIQTTVSVTALIFSGPMTLPNGLVQSAYASQTLGAIGGTPPYTFTLISGALPPGITLSGTGNNTFSGTPTLTGVYSFTLRARDASTPAVQTADRTFTVTIAPSLLVPAITTTSLSAARIGQAYNGALTAVQGTQPFTWSLAGGSLCNGLTLGSDGSITGTPTDLGPCTFTVQVTDANSQTDSKTVALSVYSGPPGRLQASVQVAATSALVTYGYKGMPADAACQIALWAGTAFAQSVTNSQGPARRFSSIDGLTPNTQYNLDVDCGGEGVALIPITTSSPATGTAARVLSFKTPSWATQITVGWGLATVSENSVTQACTGACQVSLPSLQQGKVYRIQYTWKNADASKTSPSSIRYVLVN